MSCLSHCHLRNSADGFPGKNTHHLSSDAAAFGRDDIYPEQLCKLCSLFTYNYITYNS